MYIHEFYVNFIMCVYKCVFKHVYVICVRVIYLTSQNSYV